MQGLLGQPAQATPCQPLTFGQAQRRHTAAITPQGGPSLDLHHQQPLRFAEDKVQLTPTASPVAIEQSPAALLQQTQHPLFSPSAEGGCGVHHQGQRWQVAA